MSEVKWTPGPWRVEGGGFVGGPVGYGYVCQFWNKWEQDFNNHEANARLIATAPLLYKQLAAARDIFLECAEDAKGTPFEQYFKDMAWDCDSVLAKARGESGKEAEQR